MTVRDHSVSRIERIASFVAAVGLTFAAGLFAMLAPGRGLLSVLAQRWTTQPTPERVVYVAPPRLDEFPRVAIDPPREVPSGARSNRRASATIPAPPNLVEPTATASGTIPPQPSDVRPDTAAQTTASPKNALSPRVTAGAPLSAAIVGFTRPSQPIRFDSAIAAVDKRFKEGVLSGILKPPPPTQDEIDAKWRERAFEAVAARAEGRPARMLVPIGGGISAPLPFGGPSKKQRERDRAIFAELQKTVAARQRKADSIAAARKRRADSLALVADSGRYRNY